MNVKRLIIILSAAVMLAAALILYYNLAVKDKRSAADYYASVNALISAGDYGGAAAECSNGLRHYPESAELYILKARAYLLSGDTVKALGTLDYGYKQTQSAEILEQRGQIDEVFIDDIEFLPITETAVSSEKPGGSSGSSGVSGGETSREFYHPDSSIKAALPNVSPPPELPKENIESSDPEPNTDLGENKTESE